MSKKLTSSCNDALQANQNQIILYQPSETISLEVRLENDTVWLTQEQIAVLFGVKRPAITKHIRNIFETLELEEDSVCSILERTASDGKRYMTQFYNLDMILSVGYRVNSRNAVLFRRWASSVLNSPLSFFEKAMASFTAEQLQDPDIKKEYDDLQPERAIIQALIDAAQQDLGIAGVVLPAELDAICKRAIVTYCKMNFGEHNPEYVYRQYKESYDEQKAQLSMATGYTEW